ncbi:MAG: rhomboid family intramembrane serine protease [Dehalococcoidia bacterium]
MIPIGDSLRSRTFPIVNSALILVNFLVFFVELSQPNLNAWVFQWGTIPCFVDAAVHGSTQASCAVQGAVVQTLTGDSPLLRLLTSMFIHGGWLHILGNMLFLFVFGDNVEDAIGHAGYLIFYLVCGLLADLAQTYADPASAVPAVGASGAIAGVLGAYLVLYPRASVRTVIPIFFIPFMLRIPAFVLMLFWFLTQIVGSSLFTFARATGGSGGVAYMAHVAGFVAGVVLIFVFRSGRRSIDLNRRPRFGQ